MRNSNRVKRSKRVVSSGRNHWHGGSAKRPRKTVTHTGWISMFREVSKKSFCFLSFSLGSLWHWFFVIPNLNSVLNRDARFTEEFNSFNGLSIEFEQKHSVVRLRGSIDLNIIDLNIMRIAVSTDNDFRERRKAL